MPEAKNDERISAYLDEELTSSETKAFEQRLQSDRELRQAVQELRRLRARFGELPSHLLGEGFSNRVLLEIDARTAPELASKRPSRRSRSGLRLADWRIWVTIAAALLVAGSLWYRSTDGPTVVQRDSAKNSTLLDTKGGRAEGEGDESNKVAPRDPSVDQIVAQLQLRNQSVMFVEVVTDDGDPDWFEKYLASHEVKFEPGVAPDADGLVDVIYVTATPPRMAWLLQQLARPPASLNAEIALNDADTGRPPHEVFATYARRDGWEVDQHLMDNWEAGQLARRVAGEPEAEALRVSPRQLDTLVRRDRMRERRRDQAPQADTPEMAVVLVVIRHFRKDN